MGLHPQDFSVVPEETTRVARAAFPRGNAYMTLRDELGVIYEDRAFVPLFGSARGRPAESPGCLALVTVLQFAEAIRRLTGNGVPIAHRPLPLDDPKVRQPDISRAREVLGWQPAVPLARGLEATIEYFHTHREPGQS